MRSGSCGKAQGPWPSRRYVPSSKPSTGRLPHGRPSARAVRDFGSSPRRASRGPFFPLSSAGGGAALLDIAIAAEELSRVDVNVPTTLLGNGLSLYPLIHYGTTAQKQAWLRPFADDTEGHLLAAMAFTDVAGGANFDSPDPGTGIQTLARREEDEWVINGHKHFTTNGTGWDGNGCQLYTVICRIDPSCPPTRRSPSSWCQAIRRASLSPTSTTRWVTGASRLPGFTLTMCEFRWETWSRSRACALGRSLPRRSAGRQGSSGQRP